MPQNEGNEEEEDYGQSEREREREIGERQNLGRGVKKKKDEKK